MGLAANAQKKTPEQLAGVYYAYPSPEKGGMDESLNAKADEPSSFILHPSSSLQPFYISHYGRHGSRWLPNDERYEWVNRHFDDKRNLTPLGKSVRKRLVKIWKNARGNGGQLTPLGGRQHEGIARRMYDRFPQLFTADAHITAHSSTVSRCKSSMEHFVGQLKRANPDLQINPITREEDMAWIAYTSPEEKQLEQRTRVPLSVSPDRLMRSLFKDPSKVENPTKLLTELHTIASDMQDVEIGVSLYDIFTEEELWAVYRQNNERMTICNGDVIQNEGIPARSAISLWRRIEADADAMIASGGKGADLRFGHDTNLYRLLTLMGVDTKATLPTGEGLGERPGMDEILPMAANLQMVFYKKKEDGRCFVQLFHNEQSIGFYEWDELKKQVDDRIHRLEHMRQLYSLNTMVGTAQANTKTAGLFGKGSEEHGQTLPAVLAPNGQNFWTPQTQDTEQKCIAPYYYADSLFQGFRNSHWIVGGCTQDYGSFTVATLGGSLRTSPTDRATRFTHADEVSHPHYYAVNLPDEHLRTELTASSHCAMLRVISDCDQLVHIVLNPNSDEGQGFVRIDTAKHQVYGYNPVHRIYQGWGEPAGFSGHFLLKYNAPLVDFGSFKEGVGAYLTFQSVAGVPLELVAASSFTGEEGCLSNMKVEAEGKSFEQMKRELADKWIARLHTIDVEDPDTARVNQFYGALYRASFLPREFSDAAPITHHLYFTDFSAWDTYRALHPLYNIIQPTLSGRMMQSLVDMYDVGGWLPIFPCWNSYTAAMIGDHCATILADAYVKGVRNFDVQKAYEAMRKNAFQTPVDSAEYKNGMGRRALTSYLKYGYIPLEDKVLDAFHTEEQTSRTLEYAFDDFAVAQMAKVLGHDDDYKQLMKRSENWHNVINPKTGWADGRHANGSWMGNTDLIHRQPYITEGATCHYTWYVPHNIPGLISVMGGSQRFEEKLDSMFGTSPLYWHGNEPCHQIPFLFNYTAHPWKTQRWVRHVLSTEYNDTPGGLSGNDDAGQMSAWYLFASMGFYPVCPATLVYELASPTFHRVTLNLENGRQFVVEAPNASSENIYVQKATLNGHSLSSTSRSFSISHDDILRGGTLKFDMTDHP